MVLTLILLTLMAGASIASGIWGFALGHEALKGVSQPDARPTAKKTGGKETLLDSKPLVMLKEPDIIKSVRATIQRKEKEGEAEQKEEKRDERAKTLSPEQPQPQTATNQPGFPAISQDKGVTLEVRSARQQGGSLVLDVSLKNEGTSAVRFLYSFLDVTDNRGRALSASTEGLPTELPPNNQPVAGTVSIPTAVLDGAEQISLTLTDYPDQQLRLQTSGIPVR
ncbi:hypothetical protein ACE1CM_29260 [Microseira sp. BLCC-F43]